jgi:hypothetical protein
MKQETLEEAAKRLAKGDGYDTILGVGHIWIEGFEKGAQWQQEQDKNKYSEEDMINFANFKINNLMKHVDKTGFYLGTNKVLEIWKEEFKKK